MSYYYYVVVIIIIINIIIIKRFVVLRTFLCSNYVRDVHTC